MSRSGLVAGRADAPAAAALWCEQLRRLHRTATATQRRLDEVLRDLDTLELGTGPELRAAERLGKVLATYLSFAFPGAAGAPEEPGTGPAGVDLGCSSSTNGSSNGSSSGQMIGQAEHAASQHRQPVVDDSAARLRGLLARVEVAAAQLADIGRRHEAGAYAPLRRFYFSPDEPLLAISLRSEQYRRHLEGAVAACGPDSPEVANLVEEVAAALSSHTVTAFLELELQAESGARAHGAASADGAVGGDSSASSGGAVSKSVTSVEADDVEADGRGGGSLERLAVAAAGDYYSLQELRQELEVVGRSAEAAGVPVGQLLHLADLAV
ncbi:hypothetical protein HXX76_002372 [Chlamydomonas incerta]|uniref:Uncharacterized protein n=1 Tax=Chlamydomonas incerta TaxID=51695 RepID=A0A835W9T0_CHLIN|nr:hypothetical protein HXX76_002372 [Chlamydomonas incerta]|eukprot:KAG2442286.1 hypothetical protein HXX76_002372 [Chlamydomonas incerta]